MTHEPEYDPTPTGFDTFIGAFILALAFTLVFALNCQ